MQSDKVRLVGANAGAIVWEAPMKDGTGLCQITRVGVDLPVSVACGAQPGDIDASLYTFEGARRAGGPYVAVVRLAPSVTSVEIDGRAQPIREGLVVVELPERPGPCASRRRRPQRCSTSGPS